MTEHPEIEVVLTTTSEALAQRATEALEALGPFRVTVRRAAAAPEAGQPPEHPQLWMVEGTPEGAADTPVPVVAIVRDEPSARTALEAGAADYVMSNALRGFRTEAAIRNAVAHAQLRRALVHQHGRLELLARVDPLTLVLNRRAVRAELTREITRAHRYDRVLSVAILDLDAFGALNEKQGLEAADDVLRAVSTSVVEALRDVDQVGRWSGGQWLLVLPETRLSEAEPLAKRLCAAIAERRFSGRARSEYQVTLSHAAVQWSIEEDDSALVGRLEAIHRK